MIIPYERLAPETLDSLIESFITREGTDYGAEEVCFRSKVAQVKKMILSEQVVIVFDHATESVNLLPKQDLTWPWDLQA